MDMEKCETEELIEDIVKENEYLLNLLDTIPAQIYFDHDVQEKIKYEKHLTMDKKAENLKRKFSDQAELSVKNKHKRARVDPLCHKSVSQVHEELNNEKKKRKRKKKNGILLPSASLTRAANIEELQKRLQAKINELQAKRKGCSNKDPTLKKKLKTKEKKLKHKKVVLTQANEAEMQTKKLTEKKEKPEEKPVYNKDGKIIYSKLDFSENGLEEKKKSEFSGKKYKKLLKKAEEKKEKIEKLKEINPEKATTVEQKEKWKKALLKSENVKIKDNPELLKKSLKRQEKIKKKKAKVWKDRVEHTETRKQAKQEKRSKNIQKRKKDKLDHKIKRAKKKGRVIPGF
ncbi:surfeit locus protein 6 homolog [Argiope bruennichi]|uniref:Surfeit locus protein 6 n=1 Tax=Argiope bruennichi TaxID=94029 RepID=A0A8T0EY59_ARGBR|nr:surfeit locus protein 6 homolog [Argiope bruennichi]KAF8781558.1 hypothetical protein HNY73_011942 [Argiope bruennichi]